MFYTIWKQLSIHFKTMHCLMISSLFKGRLKIKIHRDLIQIPFLVFWFGVTQKRVEPSYQLAWIPNYSLSGIYPESSFGNSLIFNRSWTYKVSIMITGWNNLTWILPSYCHDPIKRSHGTFDLDPSLCWPFTKINVQRSIFHRRKKIELFLRTDDVWLFCQVLSCKKYIIFNPY